jgi:hypothetical protein
LHDGRAPDESPELARVHGVAGTATSSKKRFVERVLKRAVRVMPILHPVIRRPVRRTLADMTESNRFMSLGTPPVSRTPFHDIVSSFVARQTSRFGPDTSLFDSQTSRFEPHSSFFDSHSSRRMRDMTELMTIITAPVSLMVALLFHITAVLSVIRARMTVILALLSLILRMMPVMTALMIDMTEVVSVVLRMKRLISGVLWLSKDELSDTPGKLTGPDRGFDGPTGLVPLTAFARHRCSRGAP